jgi:ABC-type glycerol-3-phosphate transport system substrate-binding protein
MRRRGVGAAALVTVAGLALTACSSGEPDTSSSSGGQVTITYATVGSDPLLAAEQKIIDAFEVANPTIKVKVEKYNFEDYDTKLTTAFRGGAGPDVLRVNHPNVQAWGNAGYLADLTAVVNSSGFEKAAFVPGLLQIGLVGSKQYSLPIDTDARVLFYNPKLLKDAGISAPPATWAELLTDVQKFKGTKAYGYGFRSDSDYAMAYETVGPYMKAAGGQILNTEAQPQAVAGTDQKTIDAVTLLQNIVKTGAVPPGENNMGETTINNLFTSDKVAMMTGGPWVREAILKAKPDAKLGVDYAVAPIPAQEAGGITASTSGGWQIGAGAKSANLDATKSFISFYEQPANLTSLASSNSFPPLVTGLDAAPFAGDPFYDPFKAVLPNSGLPITPVAQMAQVSAVFEKNVRAAVNQGDSAQAKLTAFDDEVNKAVLK